MLPASAASGQSESRTQQRRGAYIIKKTKTKPICRQAFRIEVFRIIILYFLKDSNNLQTEYDHFKLEINTGIRIQAESSNI